jgi:hypothetical protein
LTAIGQTLFIYYSSPKFTSASGVYGIGRKQVLRVRKPQKKLSEIAGNRVLFLVREDVVFNKTMVALDFLLRFLSRKNEGFWFFDQKNIFVSFD